MNAERLLALYDRIADAPDAVPRLRRFVLDLAVRGKLVPQDAKDEAAAVLLKRITSESGNKRDSAATALIPYDLPNGWIWTHLGILVRHSDAGWSPKTENHAREGDNWGVLKVSAVSWDEFRPCENKQLLPGVEPRPQAAIKRGDFLISRANTAALIARAVLVEEEPINLMMSDKIVRLSLSRNCNHRFVLIVNNYADFAREHYVRHASGVSPSMKNVSRDVYLNLPIPLPPLAEQRRIVAKVDELMALCDRLEATRGAREATRDKLTAASLARLNAPDPDTFAADARFALDALPALTARPDQIKALRQTILNLAVRGKLVPQEPRDEPALELLERLKEAQIAASVQEGLRSRPPVAKLDRADMWFEFPESWALASFDDLFIIVSGVTKGQKVPAHEAIDVPYLRVANVQRGHLDLSIIKEIAVRRSDEERYALKSGDILMTEGGDWDKLGRAAIWREEIPGCIHQNHVFRVRPPSKDILPDWVITYANSLLGRSFFEEASKQTTNLASINMTQLRGCPLPLPPLAEQHRVVAKVDALMALCDRLEASLGAAEATRRRLLEAVLAEVLAPDAGRQLEAAE